MNEGAATHVQIFREGKRVTLGETARCRNVEVGKEACDIGHDAMTRMGDAHGPSPCGRGE